MTLDNRQSLHLSEKQDMKVTTRSSGRDSKLAGSLYGASRGTRVRALNTNVRLAILPGSSASRGGVAGHKPQTPEQVSSSSRASASHQLGDCSIENSAD